MEKCKTKLVPKLIANQNKFTKKIIDRMYKRRVKEELGQGKKKNKNKKHKEGQCTSGQTIYKRIL